MLLSSDEKKSIIKKLKEHTDVAEYAFKDALKQQKLSEKELLFLVENIEIISVLKPVITANRNGQRKTSRKNNEKYRESAKSANIKVKELEQENLTLKQKVDNLLKELTNIENSEIYQLGKWLTDTLTLSNQERKTKLAKKDLVHIQDHQNDVGDLVTTLQEHNEIAHLQLLENERTILSLQETIDNQNNIIRFTEEQIIQSFGLNNWNRIKFKIQQEVHIDEAS